MKAFAKKAVLALVDTDYTDKNDSYYMKILAALDEIPVCGEEPEPEPVEGEEYKQPSSYSGYEQVGKKKKTVPPGEKPKRKPSAWLTFSKSLCADGLYKEKGYGQYFECVTGEASPQWKEMDEEQKEQYKS